jgi:hypothetical protein
MAANVRRAQQGKTVCHALQHPIRVRILEVLCETDISPIQFIKRGMVPPGIEFESEQRALSHIAYHFLTLAKADCIELVDTQQRRGATEHIYRSKARAFHTDEEWGLMTFDQRRGITRSTLQMLVARADGAIIAGTFDKRRDRHLSWLAISLDEEGWDELRDLQAETLERAEAIRAAVAARGADPVETFPATFGALAFESPPISHTGANPNT